MGCWVSLLLLTLECFEKRHICPYYTVFGVFTALPNLQIYFQAHVSIVNFTLETVGAGSPARTSTGNFHPSVPFHPSSLVRFQSHCFSIKPPFQWLNLVVCCEVKLNRRDGNPSVFNGIQVRIFTLVNFGPLSTYPVVGIAIPV